MWRFTVKKLSRGCGKLELNRAVFGLYVFGGGSSNHMSGGLIFLDGFSLDKRVPFRGRVRQEMKMWSFSAVLPLREVT